MSFHWNLSSEDEFEDGKEEEEEEQHDACTKARTKTDSNPFPTDRISKQDDSNLLYEKDWKPQVAAAAAIQETEGPSHDPNNDDDNTEDEVDWEDAFDEEEHEELVSEHDPSKPAATTTANVSLGPITITMGPSSNGNGTNTNTKTTQQKRKRRRNVFRNSSLSLGLADLLKNLHKTHILSLLSRAVLLSKVCSNHEILHLALSLIPFTFHETHTHIPTLEQVKNISLWYFHFINHVHERRHVKLLQNTAAGAPAARKTNTKGHSSWRRKHASTYAYPAAAAAGIGPMSKHPKSYCGSTSNTKAIPLGHGDGTPLTLTRLCSFMSSTYDENPQLAIDNNNDNHDEDTFSITLSDKVQLLVAILRSMGWRARLVTLLDPLQQDLDVNHPMLALTANIFQTVWHKAKRFKNDYENSHETTTRQTGGAAADNGRQPIDNSQLMTWVEVLCMDNTSTNNEKNIKTRWIHVDIQNESINQPRLHVEAQWYAIKNAAMNLNLQRRLTAVYVIGVEHLILPLDDDDDEYNNNNDALVFRLTDVTPRYANSWSKSLRMRNDDCHGWLGETIHIVNSVGSASVKQTIPKQGPKYIGRRALLSKSMNLDKGIDSDGNHAAAVTHTVDNDTIDIDEIADLTAVSSQEIMPTTKASFASHATFALSSQLDAHQVLAPGAKTRSVAMFKGEVVYLRSDVSIAKVAKKWLYEGRQVKDCVKPVKRVKARKKTIKAGFQQLSSYGVGNNNDGSEAFREKQIALGSAPEDDGMDDLFAIWQTEPWSPFPVSPNDKIPVNDYGNIELALLNPGLVHVNRPRSAQVAKKLGIPYAPCLLGFEGHGGNRTPTIRGIVVHQHNADLLHEACTEHECHVGEMEQEELQKRVHKRWKKLIHGILLKARLEREYGDVEQNGKEA